MEEIKVVMDIECFLLMDSCLWNHEYVSSCRSWYICKEGGG